MFLRRGDTVHLSLCRPLAAAGRLHSKVVALHDDTSEPTHSRVPPRTRTYSNPLRPLTERFSPLRDTVSVDRYTGTLARGT